MCFRNSSSPSSQNIGSDDVNGNGIMEDVVGEIFVFISTEASENVVPPT